MKRTMSVTRKLIALFLAVALPAISGAATTTSPPGAGPNISSEVSAIDAWAANLLKLKTQADALRRKTARTESDLRTLRTAATDLKGRIPTLQSNVKSILNKLQTAGQLNELDQLVAGRLRRNAEALTLIRSAGGAKALLEQLGNQKATLEAGIEELVNSAGQAAFIEQDNLRTRRFMAVSHRPEPALFRLTLTCLVLAGRAVAKTVKTLLNTDPSQQAALEQAEQQAVNDLTSNCD
ncbi:MAG TPA: hypothetical protein VNO70_23795 [Blastocatellia bacterium]|nr:hypothetical protein [Blastocatellia bacterium]